VAIANAAFTGKVNEAVRTAAVLSVTVRVKAALPAAAGVPARTPAELMLRPDGNPTADQVYTPEPPVAANVCEYADPAVAAGNGEVVAITNAALTGRVNEPLREPAASATVTVKETLPAAGGVPAKTPAALMVSHAGRPVADQVKGAAPIALNVLE